MNEICFKQYIYKYNVCCFNELHIEFAKVILHKHRQKSSSLLTFIIVKRICYDPRCGGHLLFTIFMNISGLET